MYPSQQAAIEKIRYCENLYSRERLKTIFRLTTVVDSDALDAVLEQRGYQRVDPTRVLVRELDSTSFAIQADLSRSAPRRRGSKRMQAPPDVPPAGMQLHALLLAGIRSEHVFGFISVDRVPVACGIAVLERELVGLFDVVTLPAARRQGHAQALVESLLAWGRNNGARHAYLQVVDANQPARALYHQLGFDDLYHYWYRVAS